MEEKMDKTNYRQAMRKMSARRSYQRMVEMKESGKPICVTAGAAPMEIFFAMDVYPVLPESLAAISSGIKQAGEFYELTDSMGYSRDICSYTRCGLGLCIKGKCAFGPLPEPDLLMTDANLCCLHVNWWRYMSESFNLPCYIVDAPQIADKVEQHHVDFYIEQIKGMIKFIEDNTDQKYDEEKLKQAIRYSDAAGRCWAEVHNLRKTIPTPCSFRDLAGQILPIVTAPGSPEAAEFYAALLEEVQRRVAANEGVAETERFRLIWDNIPMWHALTLINYFEEKGAVFVYESYTNNIWGNNVPSGALDPDRPFETLAEKYLTVWINYPLEERIRIYSNAIEEYKVDGLVLFSNRSCRPNSMGQYELAKAIRERHGVPALILEGDMGDAESYNEADTKARVDSFIELMEKSRGD